MADIRLSLYSGCIDSAFAGELVWPASTKLTLTLHTSTYVPDLSAHQYVSSLTNELGTAGGYTAGGTTLSSATSTIIAANSWTASRAALTAYLVGQIVRPAVANGYLYRCSVAGTTAAGLPSYPTVVGECVTDGTVTWTCVGSQALVLDAANLSPAWAAFTAGPFRHLVLSDRAAALPANQPLIGVYTFASDQTGGGGGFNVLFDASGGVIAIPVP